MLAIVDCAPLNASVGVITVLIADLVALDLRCRIPLEQVQCFFGNRVQPVTSTGKRPNQIQPFYRHDRL